VPRARIPRIRSPRSRIGLIRIGLSRSALTRIGLTRVVAGTALLLLAGAVGFLARSAGSLRVLSPPPRDRGPVTVILLVVAAAAWEFILTLVAVRMVRARQIMRRHRLERLAMSRPAEDSDPPGLSAAEARPPKRARQG
jgi:hypothetical protein